MTSQVCSPQKFAMKQSIKEMPKSMPTSFKDKHETLSFSNAFTYENTAKYFAS